MISLSYTGMSSFLPSSYATARPPPPNCLPILMMIFFLKFLQRLNSKGYRFTYRWIGMSNDRTVEINCDSHIRVRQSRALTDELVVVEALDASTLSSKPRASRMFSRETPPCRRRWFNVYCYYSKISNRTWCT